MMFEFKPKGAGGLPLSKAHSGPMTGKTAAPFQLKDADGRNHSLDDYRGRWLLLVFHRHLG